MDADGLIDMLLAAGVPGALLAGVAWLIRIYAPQAYDTYKKAKEAGRLAAQEQRDAFIALAETMDRVAGLLEGIRNSYALHDERARHIFDKVASMDRGKGGRL